MKSKDIIRRRMENQGITGMSFPDTETMFGRMGCIQAQDFAQAKWALGMRVSGSSEAGIDRDFNEGKILRTHVLRPTWHFVLPADIGWMLKLTAPRIKAFSRPVHRQLSIDTHILRLSKKIMAKALEGGKQMTRQELAVLLRKAGIDTNDIRMSFLMMDAELDGLICSGARKGKQFTYTLLEERVKRVLDLTDEEALGELARRYFYSRGPATLPDFAWWSGLNLALAKRGLEIGKAGLECTVTNGQAYWFQREGKGKDTTSGKTARPAAGRDHPMAAVLLLPAYDEYAVAYKDRSDMLPPEYAKTTFHGLKPIVVVNGRVAGMWRRTQQKGRMTVEPMLRYFCATRQNVFYLHIT